LFIAIAPVRCRRCNEHYAGRVIPGSRADRRDPRTGAAEPAATTAHAL